MRLAARIAAFAVGCSSILALSACGSQDVALNADDRYYKGAEIFAQRCAGCHSLDVAGTQGSASSSFDKEISDGPDFNQRKVTVNGVLYALENGGYSGKVMPPNLASGADARAVAEFSAKYAGRDAERPAGPQTAPATAEGDADVAGEQDANEGAAADEPAATTGAGSGE